MSWLSDIVDEVRGFIGDDGPAIADGLDFARNVGSALNQNRVESGGRNDIVDLMAAQAQAAAARRQQLFEHQLQNAAAARAASAANARAAAVNQQRALAAQKKALRQQTKDYKKLAEAFSPYTSAIKDLVPKQTQNFGQALDTSSMLMAYLAPKAQEALGTAPKSLTEYMPSQKDVGVKMPQTQNLSFPDLNELLKRGG